MKKLVILAIIVLNTLLVACSNTEKTTSVVSEMNHEASYAQAMAEIIASDSAYATDMTDKQVADNNSKVFTKLKNTLVEAGCYNATIEKAYFNQDSIKLGYKPADFNAMCLIAK